MSTFSEQISSNKAVIRFDVVGGPERTAVAEDMSFLNYRLGSVEVSHEITKEQPDIIWYYDEAVKSIRYENEQLILTSFWEEGELNKIMVTMLANQMDKEGLHPFHSSSVVYRGHGILLVGGENKHGKSMTQLEGCRRGASIFSTETTVMDHETGIALYGSKNIYVRKRAKGTERSDLAAQHEGLNMDNTILDELIYEYGINEEQARRYLGAFLFHGDEVLRRIGDLSGGEQSRVAFLKLMLTGANFLVLDEPTNHLDIPAREAIEEALMAFPGTFLAVSHDRYFLDKVANCTLELENGKLTEYLGNYSYYLMKKEVAEEEAREEREELEAAEREQQARAMQEAAARRKAAAEDEQTDDEVKKAAERRAEEKKRAELGRIQSMSDAKREEMVQRAEAEIAMAEAELKGLEFQMNNPAVQADPQQSQAIAEAYAAKEKEIEMRYEKWERLTEA